MDFVFSVSISSLKEITAVLAGPVHLTLTESLNARSM
jgi:hypothetical protein